MEGFLIESADLKEREWAMVTTYEFLHGWVRSRCVDDRGASLVEYALLLVLIAIVCLIAVEVLGTTTSESFSGAASQMN